jgi:hypothetical protein
MGDVDLELLNLIIVLDDSFLEIYQKQQQNSEKLIPKDFPFTIN